MTHYFPTDYRLTKYLLKGRKVIFEGELVCLYDRICIFQGISFLIFSCAVIYFIFCIYLIVSVNNCVMSSLALPYSCIIKEVLSNLFKLYWVSSQQEKVILHNFKPSADSQCVKLKYARLSYVLVHFISGLQTRALIYFRFQILIVYHVLYCWFVIGAGNCTDITVINKHVKPLSNSVLVLSCIVATLV